MQILKDDKKRAEYDKYGAASQQPGFDANAYESARSFGAGGFGGFGGFNEFGNVFGGGRRGSTGSVFDHLFETFAGAAGSSGQVFSRGDDIEMAVGISFMEACKGTTRTVNVTPVSRCGTCSGTGLKAGAARSTCQECHGTGARQFTVAGGFRMQTACNTCHGTGSTIPPGGRCGSCAGLGQVRTRKTVTVDIPPGAGSSIAVVFNVTDAPYNTHQVSRTV